MAKVNGYVEAEGPTTYFGGDAGNVVWVRLRDVRAVAVTTGASQGFTDPGQDYVVFFADVSGNTYRLGFHASETSAKSAAKDLMNDSVGED
jgi:hypothetical protein